MRYVAVSVVTETDRPMDRHTHTERLQGYQRLPVKLYVLTYGCDG